MPRLRVDSSAVDAVRYDPAKRRLAVNFHNEGDYTYYYMGVPPLLVDALERSDSIGRFINVQIKPFYPFRRTRRTVSH